MALHTYYEMCERCVTVLYAMSKGDENAPINYEDFFRECTRLKIFDLTRDEFLKFKQRTISVPDFVERARRKDLH